MSFSIDYDEFLNMASFGSPTKPRLDTIPESLTETSSMTAATVSPTDFSGQLEAFLPLEDSSTPPEGAPEVTQWNSPRLPKNKARPEVESYLENVLTVADKQRQREKRVRYEDLGASPKKRIKMATRLEELVYHDNQQEVMWSDGDLIKLQMSTILGLRQDNAELATYAKQQEEEKTRLAKRIQQQTDRQAAVLNKLVKWRGLELKHYGESLISIAEEETSAYDIASSKQS